MHTFPGTKADKGRHKRADSLTSDGRSRDRCYAIHTWDTTWAKGLGRCGGYDEHGYDGYLGGYLGGHYPEGYETDLTVGHADEEEGDEREEGGGGRRRKKRRRGGRGGGTTQSLHGNL